MNNKIAEPWPGLKGMGKGTVGVIDQDSFSFYI